jgi:hypothetical protein
MLIFDAADGGDEVLEVFKVEVFKVEVFRTFCPSSS